MKQTIDYTPAALSFVRFLTERNFRPDFKGYDKETTLGKIVMVRLRIDEFIHLNPAVSKWLEKSTLGSRNARLVLRAMYRHLHTEHRMKALTGKHLWMQSLAESTEFRTLMVTYHSGESNDTVAISG